MARRIVGVMGGGSVTSSVMEDAFRLGELIAERGWVLLNGGRSTGVMEASARGASSKGGLVVGVLPNSSREGASEYLDICIVTGMGNARNAINVLSSDVVIACAGGMGTISEIALAIKSGVPVIALGMDTGNLFSSARGAGLLHSAASPQEAIHLAAELIGA
nr:TIGR00725 family protein [Anaerolineae bacterium]